ncbi:MAG: hypothetical protein DRI61_08670 [Chloroflexi bacterium]|nr:MAG: hypothetical protein DRI61_08670 [Chloroflexota bacterium]
MERRTHSITFLGEDPRFLAALLDSMVDMVIVANPDGTIKAVNRAVLDILGYEPEELIGENVGKIFAVEVEVEVEVFKGTSLSQLVKEGALRDVKMTLLSKAGEKVPALVSGSVVRDEEGKLLGVMVIAHDLRKLERLMAELEAIRGLGRELVLAADKERIIKMTLETATKVLHFESMAYLEVDESRNELVLKAIMGRPMPKEPFRIPIYGEKGITAVVARTGEPIYVPDVTLDPRYICLQGYQLRSELDVPVKIKGKVLGVINVEDEEVNAYTEEDLTLLSTLADQMALALENARLFQAERGQRELAEALAEAITVISGTLKLEEVLDRILEQVEQVVPGNAFNIMVLDGGKARVVRWRGYERFGVEDEVADLTLPITTYHTLLKMAETGEPVLIPDTSADPHWVRWEGWDWLHSYVAAPIQFRGATIGFLNVDGERPGQFGPADAQRLEVFAAGAAVAIHNARLAEELAESEARYRLLSEANLGGVYLFQDNVFRYVNPALAAMFGYTVDEIVNRLGPLDLVAPSDRPMMAEKIRKHLKGETTSVRYTFQGLRKDGKIIHCEALGTLTDYRGHPAILGTILDVTEQVQAQEEIHRRAREMEALYHLAEALASSLDLEEMLRSACQTLCEITGLEGVAIHLFEPEEKQGYVLSKVTDFRLLPITFTEEDIEGWGFLPQEPTFLEDIMSVPCVPEFVKQRGFISGAFIPLYTRDKMRCFLVLASKTHHPWTEEEKKLLSAIGRQVSTAVDKAFLHRKEKEMQERLFQAEKLASLGQLISGVAHELNNPLTSVVGYAQMLAQDPSIPERVKKDLARIQEQARRAANIVQNLLDFARKRPPRRELTDINELLRKTLNLRAYEMKVENVKLLTQFDPNLPWTMVDQNQIQQVFLNIIINAEQAMSEAHGKGTLRVRTGTTEEGLIRVEISDDGPGIPPEMLSRIFDPFFTTRDTGTGLGLAIAYSFVAEHKGRIWARNNAPDPGVTFYIELPVEKGEEVSWAEETLERWRREKERERSGKCVLVVEDEEAIAELLKRLLEEEGHTVDIVSSGEAALEFLRLKPCDLIITDIKMPGIGGKNLYARVKEMDDKLAQRIIFITGDVLEPSTQAFLASTGNPFLTKPFNLARIRELTRELLATGSSSLNCGS